MVRWVRLGDADVVFVEFVMRGMGEGGGTGTKFSAATGQKGT